MTFINFSGVLYFFLYWIVLLVICVQVIAVGCWFLYDVRYKNSKKQLIEHSLSLIMVIVSYLVIFGVVFPSITESMTEIYTLSQVLDGLKFPAMIFLMLSPLLIFGLTICYTLDKKSNQMYEDIRHLKDKVQ